MPKQVPAIPNELLQAKLGNRQELSDLLLITASQLGMIVCRSTDELQEDRKVGKPPPFVQLGEKSVRYRLGSVRDHLETLPEYHNTTQARLDQAKRALGFPSFTSWIDGARPSDEWPFLIPKKGPPVDFWKSLTLGDALSDEDECGMLRLDDYLRIRQEQAWIAEGNAEGNDVEVVTAAGNVSTRTKPHKGGL